MSSSPLVRMWPATKVVYLKKVLQSYATTATQSEYVESLVKRRSEESARVTLVALSGALYVGLRDGEWPWPPPELSSGVDWRPALASGSGERDDDTVTAEGLDVKKLHDDLASVEKLRHEAAALREELHRITTTVEEYKTAWEEPLSQYALGARDAYVAVLGLLKDAT